MTNVFEQLVGQPAATAELLAAASAARQIAAGLDAPIGGGGAESADAATAETSGDLPVGVREAMTHAWLFTGPPGSGRSVAATCFAAALQCTDPERLGCGVCRACTTVMAGSHGDVRHIVPEGLTISVELIREIVLTAARRPTTGSWQIVIIEDADRLSEQGSNALLKAIEEPPERTVFLLCAPSIAPEDVSATIRSRCRLVALTAPPADAIASVLRDRDGIDAEQAAWAASVCGGHIGIARRLATSEPAREQRRRALGLARAAATDAGYAAAEELVASAETAARELAAEVDESETEELKTALGMGGTGKGTARAPRGAAGRLKDLEKMQKMRQTRMARDTLDRALIDLTGLLRDALLASTGAQVTPLHPDMVTQTVAMADHAGPERLLRCVEAVLECREAIDHNVKPKFAVGELVARLGRELQRR